MVGELIHTEIKNYREDSLLNGYAKFLSILSLNTQKAYLTDLVVFFRELFPEHWRFHKKFNPVALDVAVQYVFNEFEEHAKFLPAEVREDYRKALPVIRKVAKSIKHSYGLKPIIKQKGNRLYMNLNPVPETPLEDLINVNKKDIDLVQAVFQDNLEYMDRHFFRDVFDFENVGSVLGHLKKYHGNSNTTIRRKLAALRSFEKFLKGIGIICERNIIDFPMPREEKNPQKYLEYEILFDIINRIPVEFTNVWKTNLWIRDKAMLQLMFSTGARANELCSIHMEDVKGNELFIRDAKGGGSRYSVILPKARETLDIYEEHRDKIYRSIQEPEYYFLNKSGKKLDRRTIYRIFQKHMFLNNIDEKIGPHSIRHTVATFMNDNEVALQQIQKWLAHSHPNTTMVYVDNLKKPKKEDIIKFHPDG